MPAPVVAAPWAVRQLLVAAAFALAACGQPAPDAAGDVADTEAGNLRVCFAENDPPRSQRGGTGFDLDVARHLAAELDQRLLIVWLPETEQTDIESTDVDFRPLLMGQCDLQLSVPGAGSVERFRGRLVLSQPYYGAGFELIPADSTFRFDAPYSQTVAVRANTVAHLAVNAAEVPWSQQASNDGIVQAVAQGNAAAGLIWGPQLALSGIDHNANFEAPPVLRWNLHAALRKDNPLREDIDRVLTTTAFQSQVRQRLLEHGIPVREPFEAVHTRADLLAL